MKWLDMMRKRLQPCVLQSSLELGSFVWLCTAHWLGVQVRMALLWPNLRCSRPAVWWATGWSGHLSPSGACRSWSWAWPSLGPIWVPVSVTRVLKGRPASQAQPLGLVPGPHCPVFLGRLPLTPPGPPPCTSRPVTHFPVPVRVGSSSLDPCSPQLLSSAPGPCEVARWAPGLPNVGFRDPWTNSVGAGF